MPGGRLRRALVQFGGGFRDRERRFFAAFALEFQVVAVFAFVVEFYDDFPRRYFGAGGV